MVAYGASAFLLLGVVLEQIHFAGQYDPWTILSGCVPHGVNIGYPTCIAIGIDNIYGLWLTGISALILGVAIVPFERKFGYRGFGLMMMASGLSDLIVDHDFTRFLADPITDPLKAVQLAFVVFGWVLAEYPKHQIPLLALVFSVAIYASGVSYHVFFASLMLLFYYSVATQKPEGIEPSDLIMHG